MRQILALGLISVHLFGNTELGQVFKLPKLIAHYHQHHRQNPGVSFFNFLFMHYIGDDGTATDDNDDMQLPFHDYHHSCISFVIGPVSTMEPSLEQVYDPMQIIYGGRLLSYKPQEHFHKILQPPRFV